jgi:hypothetical protein
VADEIGFVKSRASCTTFATYTVTVEQSLDAAQADTELLGNLSSRRTRPVEGTAKLASRKIKYLSLVTRCQLFGEHDYHILCLLS